MFRLSIREREIEKERKQKCRTKLYLKLFKKSSLVSKRSLRKWLKTNPTFFSFFEKIESESFRSNAWIGESLIFHPPVNFLLDQIHATFNKAEFMYHKRNTWLWCLIGPQFIYLLICSNLLCFLWNNNICIMVIFGILVW